MSDFGDRARRPVWECLAEGTSVRLADGTVAPVERVVAERLSVLGYDKAWDLRQARLGRPYPPRDSTVGNLVPIRPVRWTDNGVQPEYAARFASGRVIETTINQRWPARSRDGSCRTPTWVGHDDGTLEQIREYVAKYGCQANVEDNGTWLRVRLVDPGRHRNALRDLLIEHRVWGLKGEEKRMANLPYSRGFICGLIAGLIDSDGSVDARQVEFANLSEGLVRQLGDVMLRLGVQSSISSKRNNRSEKPLWRLRVADGRSVTRLSELVVLRADRKAAALVSLAARKQASRRTATGRRGIRCRSSGTALFPSRRLG